MHLTDACPKPRNAAATRQAILAAANSRFQNASYEQVGMRDIAGDAGVDAALISRYFGSKCDLYEAVVQGLGGGSDLMDGPRAEFGVRAARHALESADSGSKLTWLAMMLRAASSPTASEVMRRTSNSRFFEPLSEYVGGRDSMIKAHLIASLLIGMSVTREASGADRLAPLQNGRLEACLAGMLQDILDRR